MPSGKRKGDAVSEITVETEQATYLKHESVLDVEQDLSRLAVVSDKNVKCVAVLHPAQQSSVRAQGNDRVTLDVQSAFEALSIDREQGIDETVELHDSLVLTEILVT